MSAHGFISLLTSLPSTTVTIGGWVPSFNLQQTGLTQKAPVFIVTILAAKERLWTCLTAVTRFGTLFTHGKVHSSRNKKISSDAATDQDYQVAHKALRQACRQCASGVTTNQGTQEQNTGFRNAN